MQRHSGSQEPTHKRRFHSQAIREIQSKKLSSKRFSMIQSVRFTNFKWVLKGCDGIQVPHGLRPGSRFKHRAACSADNNHAAQPLSRSSPGPLPPAPASPEPASGRPGLSDSDKTGPAALGLGFTESESTSHGSVGLRFKLCEPEVVL